MALRAEQHVLPTQLEVTVIRLPSTVKQDANTGTVLTSLSGPTSYNRTNSSRVDKVRSTENVAVRQRNTHAGNDRSQIEQILSGSAVADPWVSGGA